MPAYTGRFAPSPTGALHAGSLVAALASWLDARAHGGRWLVRIEDLDTPRCVPGADQIILQQLTQLGLIPDEPPVYQSQRSSLYEAALTQLIKQKQAYPCSCTRQMIASVQTHQRHGELIYPGTCRHQTAAGPRTAWRFLTQGSSPVEWRDRQVGDQRQNVLREVGDFVIKRSDGLWAYQLAVVVDDAAQGITHVVRGADLLDNTARQILLQRALGFVTPTYLHVPLVLGANGEKLSKQNGAVAVNTSQPLEALVQAGAMLGLVLEAQTAQDWLTAAVARWRC